MSRVIVAVVIGVVAGIAIGAWLRGNASTADTESAAMHDDSSPLLDERLRQLETGLADEREARMLLEDQLQALIEELERIDSGGSTPADDQQAPLDPARAERRNAARGPRDFASMVRRNQERRLNMLIDGGFSEDEANRVIRMESEAQYKAMQAAYEAQRRGEASDPFYAVTAPQSLLREELGDSEYERYLAAQGQPTAIEVTQVLDSSPGNQAGLQPGDRIISYNGERVFSVTDLRALTLQGAAGEDVVIEIERDGVPMQLNLPRGPLGITGSSANIRGMGWWGT